MNPKEFLAIKDALPHLRKQLVDSRYGRIPKSVAHLEKKITEATTRDDKAALYTLLLSECSRTGNEELTLESLRRQVTDLPNEPFPLTSLATALAMNRSTHAEALAIARQAVALAKHQERQVKYSLTCLARIALEAQEYDAFHEAVRGLIEDAPNQRPEDHRLEFDFLDRVNAKQADQNLLSKYRALKT